MKYINMRAVVLCKECVHRPTSEDGEAYGPSVIFPDYVCPCQCGEPKYNKIPPDNFYCALGERKKDDK